jgi:FixJ family two-component response regulator
VAPTWIAVIDDDESSRESLPDLLNELGFAARTYVSAVEFLASGSLEQTQCLILDVAMPGMSGPELQRELLQQGRKVPIIFITAQGDEKVRAAVLAKGAVAYMLKPFTETELRSALASELGSTS